VEIILDEKKDEFELNDEPMCFDLRRKTKERRNNAKYLTLTFVVNEHYRIYVLNVLL